MEIAATDNDLVVHAGCPRWQRALGHNRFAGPELGPIASRRHRDVKPATDVFQSDIGNLKFRSDRGERGRPYEFELLTTGHPLRHLDNRLKASTAAKRGEDCSSQLRKPSKAI